MTESESVSRLQCGEQHPINNLMICRVEGDKHELYREDYLIHSSATWPSHRWVWFSNDAWLILTPTMHQGGAPDPHAHEHEPVTVDAAVHRADEQIDQLAHDYGDPQPSLYHASSSEQLAWFARKTARLGPSQQRNKPEPGFDSQTNDNPPVYVVPPFRYEEINAGASSYIGPDPEDGRAQDRAVDTVELIEWWREHSENAIAATASKAVEYGAHDLDVMAAGMIALVAPQLEGASDQEKLTWGRYAACAFYALGKAGRMFGALAEGRLPKHDTEFDLEVYSVMMARIRETGRWP